MNVSRARGGAASALWLPVRAQETHKIGVLLDVTGGASFLGQAPIGRRGSEPGGRARHRKFEIVFEDARSIETDTVLAARKLINQSKVLAVVGPRRTGGAMAAIPIAREAEVPLHCPVSGVGVVQSIADENGSSVSAKAAICRSRKCLITQNAPAGRSWTSNIRPTLMTRMGATICVGWRRQPAFRWHEESFRRTRPTSSPQLTKLKSAGVDAIFTHRLGAPSVIVYKQGLRR